MKALVLAVALAALSSSALAGATPDAQPKSGLDSRATTVVADAGRFGSAGLTALNGGRWAEGQAPAEIDGSQGALVTNVDAGMLLAGLGVLGYMLFRPLARALRRQEQQRRAAALAATLPHTPQR
ncbi:hypothetical protein [Roseateles asaccharophilus]|uniref:Uncharacterized protein n=1 Tax=Roseateles asaccharophilus TaxID=582607 RepID=A0ABU2A6I3_9BURK|nr:hypothetical protein [Roseateles asaccharophilus]MDR7332805.1 hypothetical protein [Roseateles asaccharophilus]